MVGQAHLEAALSAYIFEYLVAIAVARNGENMTVPCQSLVLFDDTFGNVQKTNKSRTSSWVAFFMGASMSVCISVWVR